MYILKIYVEKNLDLNRVTFNGDTPFNILCMVGTPLSISYLSNIYIEKNLDLRKTDYRMCEPITYLCCRGNSQIIKRMFDIYVGKKWDLDWETADGYNCVGLLGCNPNLGDKSLQMYFLSLERDVFTGGCACVTQV